MRVLIYALVEAGDDDEALAEARSVFDRLVGVESGYPPVFDSYATFDDEASVRDGWEDVPVAASLTHDAGRDLLERAWNATVEECRRNLNRVREALDELDEDEIMRNVDNARHAFHGVGAYDGPSVFLYDGNALGIRDRERLESILSEGSEQWIVPAEVEF